MYVLGLKNELKGLARGRWCGRDIAVIALVMTNFAVSPVPASAQSASFRSVDTNSDRVLSFDELAAAFGRNGANRLLRSTDHNGDGRITIAELRRGPDDDNRDDDREDDGDDDGDDNRDDRGDPGDDGGAGAADNGGADAGNNGAGNGGDDRGDDDGDDGDDDGDDGDDAGDDDGDDGDDD